MSVWVRVSWQSWRTAYYLWFAILTVVLPSAAVATDEPPPEWLFQAHPNAIGYAEHACESFQMFAARGGEESLSWIGQMDPQTCRDLILLRDPAMIEQLIGYWHEAFEDCIEEGPSEADRATRASLCREEAEKKDASDSTQGFFGVFYVPSWACAIEAQRYDPEIQRGACMLLMRPEHDRDAWEKLFGAAYLGINLARFGGYGSCNDASQSVRLSPFAEAAFPLASRGKPIAEIETRLTALGFTCDAEPAAGTVDGVPENARRCEVGLFGHRWRDAPDASGRFDALSFGDDLRITLHPDADGRNQRTCADVQSTGP